MNCRLKANPAQESSKVIGCHIGDGGGGGGGRATASITPRRKFSSVQLIETRLRQRLLGRAALVENLVQ